MDPLTRAYLSGDHTIATVNAAREYVRDMAAEGRASFLPAGARFQPTARILIDGEDFGEAATLGHRVTTRPWVPRPVRATFQPIPLYPV